MSKSCSYNPVACECCVKQLKQVSFAQLERLINYLTSKYLTDATFGLSRDFLLDKLQEELSEVVMEVCPLAQGREFMDVVRTVNALEQRTLTPDIPATSFGYGMIDGLVRFAIRKALLGGSSVSYEDAKKLSKSFDYVPFLLRFAEADLAWHAILVHVHLERSEACRVPASSIRVGDVIMIADCGEPCACGEVIYQPMMVESIVKHDSGVLEFTGHGSDGSTGSVVPGEYVFVIAKKTTIRAFRTIEKGDRISLDGETAAKCGMCSEVTAVSSFMRSIVEPEFGYVRVGDEYGRLTMLSMKANELVEVHDE